MITPYNRARNLGDVNTVRADLIKLAFPHGGLPTQKTSQAFIDAIATGTTATREDDLVMRGGINAVLRSGTKMTNDFRYLPPTGGTSDYVLIWCHGHSDPRDTVVYAAAAGGNYATTNANHCQRIQFYGLPNTPAVATHLRSPLPSGIGMIEIALLGQYFNSINGAALNIQGHDYITADLGPEVIGLHLFPFIVAVNSVLAAGKIPVVGGFSGGGSMSVLAAALDERIRASFIHCGWDGVLTSEATIGMSAAGDGEQIQPDFYAVANSHELCILGCTDGREQHHYWNTSTTYGDGVFSRSTAEIAALQQGGLPLLAKQYGGRLEFLGFAGANDPVTDFGRSSPPGVATYPAAIANLAYASALNGSSALGDFTANQGVGHHLMHQALGEMTTTILNLRNQG